MFAFSHTPLVNITVIFVVLTFLPFFVSFLLLAEPFWFCFKFYRWLPFRLSAEFTVFPLNNFVLQHVFSFTCIFLLLCTGSPFLTLFDWFLETISTVFHSTVSIIFLFQCKFDICGLSFESFMKILLTPHSSLKPTHNLILSSQFTTIKSLLTASLHVCIHRWLLLFNLLIVCYCSWIPNIP